MRPRRGKVPPAVHAVGPPPAESAPPGGHSRRPRRDPWSRYAHLPRAVRALVAVALLAVVILGCIGSVVAVRSAGERDAERRRATAAASKVLSASDRDEAMRLTLRFFGSVFDGEKNAARAMTGGTASEGFPSLVREIERAKAFAYSADSVEGTTGATVVTGFLHLPRGFRAVSVSVSRAATPSIVAVSLADTTTRRLP